ncbi:hypothetical protein OEA41_007419 [Lepraria neglecta]|uniref:Fungal N-terminal domain-containing protein n=1 Tax=Lepraria neglecta TaxID=209136 RepID=A0AAE0DN84_9LECA|nr:hypothetical protein OEA41_007419 [Lepraria neglecta]
MADPLSIIGGLAAGIQLASTAAQALLATVKLIRDLKDIPERLTLLLGEVENSISRLCQSCNAGSKILQNLDRPQLDRLSGSVAALYPVMLDIHNMLMPLVYTSKEKGASVRGLWQLLVSLKVEKELSQKLERLNGLNIEMIRELGILGLEVQVTTNRLVIANNAASKEAFSNLEAKMDSLYNDFQKFTLSINQAHNITLEKPNHRCITLDEWSPSPRHKLSENSRCSSSNSDHDSETTPESTIPIQELADETRPSRERAEQMHRYLAGGSGIGTTSALNVLSPSQLPSANLEFILFSIRTFYTTGNFNTSSIVRKTEFWNDTDLAIYLMKVSAGAIRGSTESQTRGLRLLKKLTANDTKYALDQSTATILIELLSTLSPVNTSACPYVRNGLLRYLSELVREQLPRDHPISLVINKLEEDNGDIYISLRALTFIVERLRSTLGPIHELTQLATHRLCALLRRSGDYSETLRVAHDGLRAIRAVMGSGTLPERLLLRRVEHVYMDQRDWAASLSICFDIVSQQLDVPNPDPLYHDECAVYTMEDITKTCECAGNLEQVVAWLKQARISGGVLWGRTEALAHIQDKLYELLRETGRKDELEIWSKTLDAEETKEQNSRKSD